MDSIKTFWSTTGKNEWLTPPSIVKALGEFDLDPCSPIVRPWTTAKKHYTVEDDGLKQDWGGREFGAILRMDAKHKNG